MCFVGGVGLYIETLKSIVFYRFTCNHCDANVVEHRKEAMIPVLLHNFWVRLGTVWTMQRVLLCPCNN